MTPVGEVVARGVVTVAAGVVVGAEGVVVVAAGVQVRRPHSRSPHLHPPPGRVQGLLQAGALLLHPALVLHPALLLGGHQAPRQPLGSCRGILERTNQSREELDLVTCSSGILFLSSNIRVCLLLSFCHF